MPIRLLRGSVSLTLQGKSMMPHPLQDCRWMTRHTAARAPQQQPQPAAVVGGLGVAGTHSRNQVSNMLQNSCTDRGA